MSYDPETATWREQDPAGPQYIDGLNLYEAFDDNPMDRLDPDGYKGRGGAATQPTLTQQQQLQNQLLGILSNDQQKCPTCQQEANDLAKAIADAVNSQPWQIGGNTGNIISGGSGFIWGVIWTHEPFRGAEDGGWGNQCGDWQNIVNNAVMPVLQKYYGSGCFKVYDMTNNGKTHNWVEIHGAGGTIPIDPWPTGGGQIIDPSHTGNAAPGTLLLPNPPPGGKPSTQPCCPNATTQP